MTQPTDWNNGTITGRFLNDDYTPFVGSAVVKAAVPAIRVYGQAVVSIGDRTVPLVNGSFSLSTPASTDEDISPKDWTYSVTVAGPGLAKSKFPTFTFKLDPGTTVDLTQVTIVAPSGGLPNIVGGGGVGGATATWSDIDGKPAVVAAGATAAEARAAIAAGTSNLAVGTTAGTAKDGAWKPTWGTDIIGTPALAPAAHTHTLDQVGNITATGAGLYSAASGAAARTVLGFTSVGNSLAVAADAAAARTAIGLGTIQADVAAVGAGNALTPLMLVESGGVYPNPTTTQPRIFVGVDNPAGISALAMDASKDVWLGTV